MYTSSFLLALGLAAQGAVATGGWGSGKSFSCPGNTPTTCSSDQSSGFNWGSATVGQQVTSYGGCGFSGVTCQAQGPGGKLHKRTGGASDKCVSGPIHGDASSCPKMSAGKGSGSGNNFSPTNYQVSCSYDTQVDFTYSMADGSTCKHTSPCQAGGNTVQNTQCGGAVSVTCSQSSSEKQKNNGKECSMGIHSIGFQCGPSTSIVPPSPPKSSSTPATKPVTSSVATHPETTPVTQSKPATTPVTESKPATTPVSSKPATECTPGMTAPGCNTPSSTKPATECTPGMTSPGCSTPSSSKPATECTPGMTAPGCNVPGTTAHGSTTPVPSSKPISSTAGVPPYQPPANSSVPVQTTPVATSKASSVPVSSFATTTFMTTSTVFHTTEITVTSCAPTITNCPAESKTPMVITSTLSSFVTVCPVTATMVPSGSSMVPVVIPSSTPGATTPVATSKAPSSAPSTPSSSSVPLNCPDVVPSCINTLLQSMQTECQNNADASCFCAAANHTQFIQDCIVSHGSDAAEVQTALSYLQGLCAPQVPQNPSIITHQPEGAPQAPIVPSGIPATTITVAYTTTVPCSATNAPATSAPGMSTIVNTVTSVSMTVMTVQSTVTVPQVQVTAPPAAPGAATTPAAALVPGYGATTAAPATQGPPATQPVAPTTPAAAATTPAAAPSVPGYGVPTVASTGGVTRPSGTIQPPIATGAAGKVGVSFGAAAVAVAFLL